MIPAFNNSAFIDLTIASVLEQTYQDIELIIADHASSDDTWDKLRRYADHPHVTLAQTPAGGGAVANWNAVSQRASGEFIKLLPGDDLLHPTCIARQVQAFDDAASQRSADTVGFVAAQRSLIDARGGVVMRARGLGKLDGLVDGKQALRATVRSGTNLFGEPGAVLMRTDMLRQQGWWQDLHYYIDAGSYAPVIAQGAMVAIRQPLASFRLSASQWSVRLMRSQAQEAAAFHRQVRALAPDVVTDADVRRGDRMAKLQAMQRRASYLVLKKRMEAEPDTQASAPTGDLAAAGDKTVTQGVTDVTVEKDSQ